MEPIYHSLLFLSATIVIGCSELSAQVSWTRVPGTSVFAGKADGSLHQQGSGPTVNVSAPQQESRLSDSAVLVKRIDHIVCLYNTIEEVDSMMRVFNGLLELPQWFKPGVRQFDAPPRSPFYNTGVYMGNVFLEFVTYNTQYPSTQTKTYRPYSHAFAFTNEITNTAGELDQRGVPRSQPYNFSLRNADQTIDTLFTNITVPSLRDTFLMIFFCRYHIELFDCDLYDLGDLPPIVNPEDQHPYYRGLLEQTDGGPLRLKGVKGVVVRTSAQSFESCRSTLSKIFLPAVEYDTGKWTLPSGPELILQSGPQGFHLATITIDVESLAVARDFLASKNLAFEETDGYVRVGLSSNLGLDLLLKDVVTSAEDNVESVPKECLLHQNYPNPFNPSTTILYDLRSRSHVMLAVFNTLGQQVATLLDAEQEAGAHAVEFDGSNLASGVYFYRLSAGESTQTKQLLLVR